MAFTPASKRNTSKNPDSPQYIGDNLLICLKVSDITKVGTQTPPMAAIITTEMAPKTDD